jgi:hypothetical protein
MVRGTTFLRSQVRHAVLQHQAFLNALEDHEDQAEDSRFRDLCTRHIPHMREHQRMLEEYQSQLGADTGAAPRMVGPAPSVARELADAAPADDYLRLVGDIVMARESEDTFKTFREAGKMMGYETLHEIGDIGERHHDAYVKEANRLVQHMFVEHTQGIDGAARRSAAIELNASL